MGILILLVSIIISAILYRAGGMGKEDTAKLGWIPKPLRQSWVRDWLCPVILILLTLFLFGLNKPWWVYLLSYALSAAALSTYWDWLFGKDNFYMHGLFCGLAGIPLIWVGVTWWIVVLRIILCSLGMGFLSEKTDKDYIEEMGRGALFIL